MDAHLQAPPENRRRRRVTPSGEAAPSRRERLRLWLHVEPARAGLVLAWAAFTVTFVVARVVTGLIKLGDGDTGDLEIGGVHLHHYLWGLVLLVVVAVMGLVDRSARTRGWMGLVLGVGLALVVDEIALLVTLEDVYWETPGWASVGVAVSIIGVAGTTLALTRGRRGGAESPSAT
ncbi:hypothetical protein DFJ68_1836 [Terracoccus luteus]|jgi:hypothetical protein|uniref:Integral membrane protein n=1 Tax=Terracoccus luteus TaxID=53356 RepID=A0A495XV03_9MICO|nr:hypothetical protein [Terracoccus luteus]RKT78391.1 hypothetical protein DFJ68_1836 [Terracoccus luteus]